MHEAKNASQKYRSDFMNFQSLQRGEFQKGPWMGFQGGHVRVKIKFTVFSVFREAAAKQRV